MQAKTTSITHELNPTIKSNTFSCTFTVTVSSTDRNGNQTDIEIKVEMDTKSCAEFIGTMALLMGTLLEMLKELNK